MLEKYSKDEIFGFIEEGYKSLGDMGSRNAAVALIRGLPADEETMDIDSVLEFLDEHGIPRDYVPPRMLARRALALIFAYNETVCDLERSVEAAVGAHCSLWVEGMDMNFRSVEEIYRLSDEKVDEFLAVIFR